MPLLPIKLTELTLAAGQSLYGAVLAEPQLDGHHVQIVTVGPERAVLDDGTELHIRNLQGVDSAQQYYLSAEAFADELVEMVAMQLECSEAWLRRLDNTYGSLKRKTSPADFDAIQSGLDWARSALDFAALHRAGKKIGSRRPQRAQRK